MRFPFSKNHRGQWLTDGTREDPLKVGPHIEGESYVDGYSREVHKLYA